MQIGPYYLPNQVLLAPMAGITDRPFRNICKKFGVGMTVSEMVAANPQLRTHIKTLQKTDFSDETGLSSVQILGTDPAMMADAARYNVGQGAKIIDINMGCPAKKVCAVAAGSALMKDVNLVKRILDAVVNAAPVPVTLKIRTGWDTLTRNAVEIAQIAEEYGVSALTVHGRTRACKFEGEAEYETIRQVKQSVNIPIIANGDIDSADKAKFVLDFTGVDAVMIGRASQGNPWLINETNTFLTHQKRVSKPKKIAVYETLMAHIEQIYSFYGAFAGVRIARKHIGWYLRHFDNVSQDMKNRINSATSPGDQVAGLKAALNPQTIDWNA